MDLGVYRREHLQSGNPELLGAATVEQFQRTHAAIGVWQEVEHTHDGHHTNITAESLDLAGDAVIHGDVTVGGDLAVGDDLTVTDELLVGGTASMEGDLTVGGRLDVADDANIQGDLHVQGNGFFTGSGVSLTGDEIVGGYLHVTGPTVLFGGANIENALPMVRFTDTDSPPNLQKFRVYGNSQLLIFDAVNDVESAASGTMVISRGGDLHLSRDIYEKDRTVPMGHWQDIPFNPANFFASGGMTWTVGAPAIVRNRYTIIGKTVTWSVYISWFSGSNIIGGTPAVNLCMTLPGIAFAGAQIQAIDYQASVAGVPTVAGLYASSSGSDILISKADGSNFTPGTAPGMIFTITLEGV